MADTSLWTTLQQWKQQYKFVELSHPVSPETPHWSGFPAMRESVMFDYPDGFFVNEYTLVSQYGTHVDAPKHFVQGAGALHEIEAKSLLLPLCVIDLTAKVADNADYAVTRQDILDWEAAHGQIPPQAFVALRTDWYLQPDMDNADAAGNKHYPGWGIEALQFLVEQRDVAAIGHETSDTDAAADVTAHGFVCEYYILEQGRFQIELLRNLSEVPPVGSLIFCGFPRVQDSAGFTARCIAICPV